MQIQKPKQGYKLVKSLFGKYEEIPEQWNIKKINEIGEVVRGGSPRPAGDPKYFGGIIPWITVGEITKDDNMYLDSVSCGLTEEGKEYSRFLKKGTFIIANSGATLGVPKILKISGCANDGVAAILNLRELVSEYLYYVIYSRINLLRNINQGMGQPNLNTTLIGNIQIPCPQLIEQQKIASILSNVDSLIQHTQKEIEQTQRLKKGLIQKLLTKGIGHNKFKQLDIFPRHLKFDIPESWEVVNFGDVSERITYGFTNPMPSTDNGPWMITATNIKNGRIDYTTARQTDWKSYKELLSDKSRPKIGTVLITKDGTLGEVAIVDKENLCINQSVASLEPKKSKITPEFLSVVLQSTLTKKLIEVFSPATTIRHISITDLAEWKLGLPPADEQQKIVSILNMCELSLQHVQNYMYTLQTLKKGLMQKLLTGQIRVKA